MKMTLSKIRIEATEPNQLGIINAIISYAPNLQEIVTLLLEESEIQEELKTAETYEKDGMLFIKVQCKSEKLDVLTLVLKSILERYGKVIYNESKNGSINPQLN